MLEVALKAKIPVLRATTSDTVNLPEVLEFYAPDLRVGKYKPDMKWAGNNDHVFFSIEYVKVDDTLYHLLVNHGKTLILINQEDESGLSFNVGEVPVPVDMMFDLVENIAGGKAARGLMEAFRGLTMKAASEIIGMVKAQKLPMTVENVLRQRSQTTGKLRGLALVDTASACYLPNQGLEEWAQAEGRYFHGAKDPRLVPRGLLFGGAPGTGKTQGAKYIAREFGVPLYRLDMAAALSRWQGESEQMFSRVLSALDQEEPCVFLIDEVEKFFESGGEDAGTTSRILGQLLWWLAEHQSRIITVMTTNKQSALPPELYREGRIDKVLHFGPINMKAARGLADALFTSFGVAKSKLVLDGGQKKMMTPAAVTQQVYDYLKQTGHGLEK